MRQKLRENCVGFCTFSQYIRIYSLKIFEGVDWAAWPPVAIPDYAPDGLFGRGWKNMILAADLPISLVPTTTVKP